MTQLHQQLSQSAKPSMPKTFRHRRHKPSSARLVLQRSKETKQPDTTSLDPGNTEPKLLLLRRWNDPGTILFLIVVLTYLVMSVIEFIRTGSPVMLTVALYYAGAWLGLNLVPILKELIWK